MTVLSSSGLIVGLSVSGTYIPPGTTISAITSNVLTLNQRPYSFSRSGITAFDVFIYIDTTGIVNGMRVFGSNGINTTVASVGTYASQYGNQYITLTNYPSILDGKTLTLYFMPISPTAGTYTFTSLAQFTFRSVDGSLPFGSFPGVGGYDV